MAPVSPRQQVDLIADVTAVSTVDLRNVKTRREFLWEFVRAELTTYAEEQDPRRAWNSSSQFLPCMCDYGGKVKTMRIWEEARRGPDYWIVYKAVRSLGGTRGLEGGV